MDGANLVFTELERLEAVADQVKISFQRLGISARTHIHTSDCITSTLSCGLGTTLLSLSPDCIKRSSHPL